MESAKYGGTEMVIDEFEAMNLPNEVIWASDFAREKLGMVVGQEYKGPLFLREPGQEVRGRVGARKFHHRSFDVAIPRKDGEKPVQVSGKGMGYYDGSGAVQWVEIDGELFGLMSLEAAAADMRNSQWLKSIGVRTAEPIAIIRLKALPVRGYSGHTTIVPIDVLKETGKISDQEFVPAVLFRVARSDTRLEDVIHEHAGRGVPSPTLLKELPGVIKDLEDELGEKLGAKKYLEWVIDIYGRNLGKMHAGLTRIEEMKDPEAARERKAMAHRFITKGNLTIRGEVIDNADFEDVTLPDMTKPVAFGDMHQAMDTAKQLQENIEMIKRDIGHAQDEEDEQIGVWPRIFEYAAIVLDTFPEAFKDDIEQWKPWGNERLNYYFEQLCPELDDTFWRAYLEEAPHLAFLHSGFRFPRQGEKAWLDTKPPDE